MKVVKKILSFILMIIIGLFIISFIDYYNVRKNKSLPRVAYKKEYKSEEVNKYYGLFYKVYECTSDNSSIVVSYFDKDSYCPRSYEYNDGYYTNDSMTNISKEDILYITYKNIYSKEIIDNMSSEDVINAKYIVSRYLISLYKEASNVSTSPTDYMLVNFPTLENGKLKYDDKIYCIKDKSDNEYSEYINNECSKKIYKIFDDKWCSLYKNSKFIYDDDYKKICD